MPVNNLKRQSPQRGLNRLVSDQSLQFSPFPADMSPGEQLLLQYHRNNLHNGTYLDDKQGLTTVYITGVQGPDGREYNVPGYYDGKRLDFRDAYERAARFGWQNFPSYSTPQEADAAAQRLHKIIEQDANAFRAYRKMSPNGSR